MSPLCSSILLMPRPPRSALFPYTTLFRSLSLVARLMQPKTIFEIGKFEGISALHFALNSPDDCRVYSLEDRKSTRLNSSHGYISYAVFCLKKKSAPC